jgi:hypothetical protein
MWGFTCLPYQKKEEKSGRFENESLNRSIILSNNITFICLLVSLKFL